MCQFLKNKDEECKLIRDCIDDDITTAKIKIQRERYKDICSSFSKHANQDKFESPEKNNYPVIDKNYEKFVECAKPSLNFNISVAIYCNGQLFGENRNTVIMLENALQEEIEKQNKQEEENNNNNNNSIENDEENQQNKIPCGKRSIYRDDEIEFKYLKCIVQYINT